MGSNRTIEVDVHVITATNRNLEEAVARGEFREDLFYRLNVLPIVLPPLREHPEDIGPLVAHFLEILTHELRVPPRAITSGAMELLESYAWPGNSRELRNVLERILLLAETTDAISREALPPAISGARATMEHALVLPAAGLDLEQLERELICQALQRSGGNKSQAARLLGLTRDTLRYRLEKYGIR